MQNLGYVRDEPSLISLLTLKVILLLGMVAHVYNSSSWEAEAGKLKV